MSKGDEARNIERIRNFCEVWEAPDYTADDLAPYLAEDCAVRLVHTLPYAQGPADVIAQARMLLPLGTERMRVRHLSIQAIGPVVSAHRIDTLIIPDQPDTDWEMLGIFLMEGGRIKEWTDYMLTPFTHDEDGVRPA